MIIGTEPGAALDLTQVYVTLITVIGGAVTVLGGIVSAVVTGYFTARARGFAEASSAVKVETVRARDEAHVAARAATQAADVALMASGRPPASAKTSSPPVVISSLPPPPPDE